MKEHLLSFSQFKETFETARRLVAQCNGSSCLKQCMQHKYMRLQDMQLCNVARPGLLHCKKRVGNLFLWAGCCMHKGTTRSHRGGVKLTSPGALSPTKMRRRVNKTPFKSSLRLWRLLDSQ